MALVGSPVTRSSRPTIDVSPSVAPQTTAPSAEAHTVSPAGPGEAPSLHFIPATSVEDVAEPRTIEVLSDQTLYRVIIENFGRYDVQMLAKIRELNPWLSNSRRIKAGQKIRIPSAEKSGPKAIFPTSERVLSGPAAAGMEKP
jgi:Tfp pilus assembly protein FimV